MSAQSNTTGLCEIGNRTADDVAIGEILCGGTASYAVEIFLDSGSFAKVAMCRNVETDEMVAIKILRDATAIKLSEFEVSIMETLSQLDCDRCNVVKFIESFEHMGLVCLVFEMLDISLFDHHTCPVSPREIRPIAQQLLVALDGLKSLGVMHTDLKTDNVMYTNLKKEPYKVKLIDFGLSILSSEVQIGLSKQAVGYRAPEVTLGCMYDEAIDMFGLGCVLAGLYIGDHLFPDCNLKSMKQLVDMMGLPPDNMLRDGIYSKCYFTEVVDENTGDATWELQMPEKNLACEDTQITFDHLVNVFPRVDPQEYEDCQVFINFLKGVMHLDPAHRLTPKEALQHPFITMSHLTDSDYLKESKHAMKCCVPDEKPSVQEQMSPSVDITEDTIADNIAIGSTLQGNAGTYSVMEFVGEGGFGKVVIGQNVQTKEMVAVKIFKTVNKEDVDELIMLQCIGELDCDGCNLVRFIERFEHMGQACHVFEPLDVSLFDLYELREGKSMSIWEIRPIAQQLLVALAALKDIGVIHSDIKADNVMLTNLQQEPYKVKLIDFGVAAFTSEVQQGFVIQPVGYRAPEVSLGYMFDEAIDMWGLGCLLGSLFCAHHFFPTHCEYQMMKHVVEMLGYPPENVLRRGIYAKCFFTEENNTEGTTWRLLTPDEFAVVAEESAGELSENPPQTLDNYLNTFPEENTEEYEDCRIFIDFLKGLLQLDQVHRLTPKEALQHPFITMSHLTDSDYLRASKEAMNFRVAECPTYANRRNTPGVQLTTDDMPELEQIDSISEDKLDDVSSQAISTNGAMQIFQPNEPIATTSPNTAQESPKFENIGEGASDNILTTKPIAGDFGSNHKIAASRKLEPNENMTQQQEANIKLAEMEELLKKTREELQMQKDNNKKLLKAEREAQISLEETQENLKKTQQELQKQMDLNNNYQKKEEELLAQNRNVTNELEVTKNLLQKTQDKQKEQAETNNKLQELLQKSQTELKQQLNNAQIKWEERLAQLTKAHKQHKEKEDNLLALKNVQLQEKNEALQSSYAKLLAQMEKNKKLQRHNMQLEKTRNSFQNKIKQLVQANKELEIKLGKEMEKNEIIIELQESIKKLEERNITESIKSKEVYNAVLQEKGMLLETMKDFENSVESQKMHIKELSITLESVKEEKAQIILEKENLTSALKTSEELRQHTGAALEQLVQLYNETKSKEKSWFR